MAALQFALYMEELVLRDELDLYEQEDVPDRGEAGHVQEPDRDAEEEEGEVEEVEEEIPQFIRPLRPDERFNLDAYNDDWLKKQLRFYRQDIEAIFIALQMPDVLRTQAGDHVTGVEALGILLYRLSSPSKLDRMRDVFNRAEGPLSRIFNCTLHWIIMHWERLLIWDPGRLTHAKLQEMALCCFRKGRLCMNVFGFIDGTCRNICRPSVGQEAVYIGRKKHHTLNYQGIVGADGILLHLSTAFDGTVNDIEMFRQTGIAELLHQYAYDTRGYPLAIYGDSAYMLGPHIITKYDDLPGMPAHEVHFNTVMNAQRTSIEWAFGKVVTQFSAVDFSRTQRLLNSPVEYHYRVAALLANLHTCCYGSQTSAFFQCLPPTIQQYMSPAMFNPDVMV